MTGPLAVSILALCVSAIGVLVNYTVSRRAAARTALEERDERVRMRSEFERVCSTVDGLSGVVARLQAIESDCRSCVKLTDEKFARLREAIEGVRDRLKELVQEVAQWEHRK